MTIEFRPHPFMIWKWLKLFVFFLIIPVAVGMVRFILFGRVTVPIWELFAAAGLVFVAGLRLFFSRMVLGDRTCTIKSGLIFRAETVIPVHNIISLQCIRTPIDLLFGAESVRIGTRARRGFFEYKLRKKDSEELKKWVFGEEAKSEVRFSAVRAAILAVANSSAVAGIFIVVPFIHRVGKILGASLDSALFNQIGETAFRLRIFFPPLVNMLTILFLLGFISSFVSLFFRNLRMKLAVSKSTVEGHAGFLTERQVILRRQAISATKRRKKLFARPFCRYVICLSAGEGRKKRDEVILIPVSRKDELLCQIEEIFDQEE